MTTQEFNVRFNKWQNAFIAFANSITGNPEDAKDLFQETAYRAYGNKDKYKLGTNFKAWVMTIMRNTFINQYRRKKNIKIYAEASDSFLFENDTYATDSNAISNLRMRDLKSILDQVGDGYTKPFLMNHNGYKYHEIADEMGLPIGTVKSRIFHARRQLKELINNRYQAV